MPPTKFSNVCVNGMKDAGFDRTASGVVGRQQSREVWERIGVPTRQSVPLGTGQLCGLVRHIWRPVALSPCR